MANLGYRIRKYQKSYFDVEKERDNLVGKIRDVMNSELKNNLGLSEVYSIDYCINVDKDFSVQLLASKSEKIRDRGIAAEDMHEISRILKKEAKRINGKYGLVIKL